MRHYEPIIEALDVLGIATTVEICEFIHQKYGQCNPNTVSAMLKKLIPYGIVLHLGDVRMDIGGCTTFRWRLTA